MFEKLDEFKSYVLGFLSADGCNESSFVSIELKKGDIHILQEIEKIFISEGYTTNFNPSSKKILCSDGIDHYYTRLRIYGTKLCQELDRIGIKPNKSLTILFPNIQQEFLWYYIRGYFDANGTIQERRGGLEIEFYSGSYEFLKQLSEKISQLTNLTTKKVSKHGTKNSYRLPYFSKEATLVLRNMYTNARIKLNRKFLTFDNFKKTYDKRFWTEEQINLLKKELKKGTKLKNLPPIIGKSYKAISKKTWEININKVGSLNMNYYSENQLPISPNYSPNNT